VIDVDAIAAISRIGAAPAPPWARLVSYAAEAALIAGLAWIIGVNVRDAWRNRKD
jgi:hypothetical protein